MTKVFLVSTCDAASSGFPDRYSVVAVCSSVGSAKEKAMGLCSPLAGSFGQAGPDLWEYSIGCTKPVLVRAVDLEGNPDLGPDLGIEELCETSAKIATEHGWTNDFVTQTLLTVSELAEATEEFREHRGLNEIWYSKTTKSEDGKTKTTSEVEMGTPGSKPEGVPIELADAVIRICDLCGQNGVDLAGAIRIKVEYNRTRPFRHGGKRI